MRASYTGSLEEVIADFLAYLKEKCNHKIYFNKVLLTNEITYVGDLYP